jgi:hypothetical protein
MSRLLVTNNAGGKPFKSAHGVFGSVLPTEGLGADGFRGCGPPKPLSVNSARASSQVPRSPWPEKMPSAAGSGSPSCLNFTAVSAVKIAPAEVPSSPMRSGRYDFSPKRPETDAPARDANSRTTTFICSGEITPVRTPPMGPPNCTCSFPAYSFHEDSFFRDASEGINPTRFTSPYSPYNLVPATVAGHRSANADVEAAATTQTGSACIVSAGCSFRSRPVPA